jgi:hypothetical protein
MQWAKLLKMNWPAISWIHDQNDVDEAASEILKVIHRNPPDNAELCEAIRWLAGPENKQAKAPSLRELIRAVFICRKERSNAIRQAYPEAQNNCGLCWTCGLVEYWPDLQPPYTLDQMEYGRMVTVPCRCARGAKPAEYQYNLDDQQWAHLQGQHAARERLFAALIDNPPVIAAGTGVARMEYSKEELCPF